MISFSCSNSTRWTAYACAWRSIRDISFSTYVILYLSSWSRLRCSFSFLRCAMFTFRWVIIFFWDNDLTTNIKSSLCYLNILGFFFTTALSFTDLSLISNSVFIGNNDVLSTNLSLWASRFWSELSISTWSFSTCKYCSLTTKFSSTNFHWDTNFFNW